MNNFSKSIFRNFSAELIYDFGRKHRTNFQPKKLFSRKLLFTETVNFKVRNNHISNFLSLKLMVTLKSNFRPKYLFGRKPVNFKKWNSIPFLTLLLISERSDHIKYWQFLFTNNTISCIIQSTFYRCKFCWNWCDTLILFIIFLRRCVDCFKIW